MIVSQTLCSSSIGDLGGLAKLSSSFRGHTPLHSHTSLAKVDRFGRVSAFIPNTPPSFLRLVKTRLGLAKNQLTPDTTRSSVQTFLPLASVEVPGTSVPPAHGWSGHWECMTRRETHSWPLQLQSLFIKSINFFRSWADFSGKQMTCTLSLRAL